MEIRSESRIAHPRHAVYRAYRDRLPEIAAYIPDIRKILVHSREEGDGTLVLHNEWLADTEIPKVAKSFIGPEQLRWDDFATWDDGAHHVDWRIRTKVFPDSVHCTGRNSFIEDGPDACIVRLAGILRIELKQIPGVPRFLARRITPQVESFIVKMITPNLEQVNRSIGRYLDESGT